jgi:hypothetical protein
MLLHPFDRFACFTPIPDSFSLHVVTPFYDKLANLHTATPSATIRPKYLLIHCYFSYWLVSTLLHHLLRISSISTYNNIVVLSRFSLFLKNYFMLSLPHKSHFIITQTPHPQLFNGSTIERTPLMHHLSYHHFSHLGVISHYYSHSTWIKWRLDSAVTPTAKFGW